VAGLSDGLKVFRTDNCLVTHEPQLPVDGAASIAEALDDRYSAFVPKSRTSKLGGPNVVVFWDALLSREVTRIDFHERVLGLRLTSKWMAVILEERTVLFQYQEVPRQSLPPAASDDCDSDDGTHGPETVVAPNLAHSIFPTGTNTFALACLTNDLLVLPAQSKGQAQLIALKPGSSSTKRVLRAHNSSLRCMTVSHDGSLLATTSEQGTLIRVFDVGSQAQLAEFRRGMDHSLIYGLAFSPGNRFVASTSDKGTLHVFDLRPGGNAEIAHPTKERDSEQRKHRKTPSYASHRMSAGMMGLDRDSISGVSVGRSSPSPSTAMGGGHGTGYQGSVQEYYGLRPPPVSASPPAREAAVSAMAALKSSPLTPRAFRDIRSVASIPFYTGNDPPHWQGGPAYSWTMAPNGTRKRIKNPILPLPNDPAGRPPKGIVAFARVGQDSTDDDGLTLYVVGGGNDARWEKFELLPSVSADSGGVTEWVLVNRGFRKYLTRQFPD
jgi:hypothetical protein